MAVDAVGRDAVWQYVQVDICRCGRPSTEAALQINPSSSVFAQPHAQHPNSPVSEMEQ